MNSDRAKGNEHLVSVQINNIQSRIQRAEKRSLLLQKREAGPSATGPRSQEVHPELMEAQQTLTALREEMTAYVLDWTCERRNEDVAEIRHGLTKLMPHLVSLISVDIVRDPLLIEYGWQRPSRRISGYALAAEVMNGVPLRLRPQNFDLSKAASLAHRRKLPADMKLTVAKIKRRLAQLADNVASLITADIVQERLLGPAVQRGSGQRDVFDSRALAEEFIESLPECLRPASFRKEVLEQLALAFSACTDGVSGVKKVGKKARRELYRLQD